MSVIFRTVERPSDPRVENSPKKYYPQLVTLGQSVDLAFRSCLNFIEKNVIATNNMLQISRLIEYLFVTL